MKKIFLISLLMLIFACKEEEKPTYVILDGKITNNESEKIMVQGHDFKSEIALAADGTFKDTLDIEKDGAYEFFLDRERTAIYLEKGKNRTINLDAKEFDETLVYSGDVAAENNYLAAKFLMDEKKMGFEEMYVLPEKEFLLEIDKTKLQQDSLLKSKKITNDKFLTIENNDSKFGNAANIEVYEEYNKYLTKNDSFKVSPTFYDRLKDIDYSDTTMYRNSVTYQQMLSNHYNRLASKNADKKNNSSLTYLKLIDENLPNGYAKDNMMTNYLDFGLKPDESLEETYTLYKNTNPSKENLDKISERYETLKVLTKGNPSPDFDYENYKGGNTSLADLKGKYTYIDVWATWCGPCIREIPSLKEVEDDYKGKNIQFVSISIDEKKDYKKWKTMIAEKQLGGVQLMADNNWNSTFVKEYGILGIPRFILVDPEGKIVSADAPRPSEPKLRAMLDKTI